MPHFQKLLLASTNKGKLKEFQSLLRGLKIEIISPKDLNIKLEVDEIGNTYTENARLKAEAYSKLVEIPVLADDSGLEVDLLGGAPGIRSARYAPALDATDADRRIYLVKNLVSFPRPWIARFRCVLAIATPDGTLQFSNGTCEGEIIPEERGQGGFGYDSNFLLGELGKTMAELSVVEKNQFSHRAHAVKELQKILEKILTQSPKS
jgi:XTP/dITP diphosphohydrolase